MEDSRIPVNKSTSQLYSNTNKFVPKTNKRYIPHFRYKEIYSAIENPEINVVMIYGFGGIGKTSLISECCKGYEEKGLNIAYFDLTNAPPFREIILLILSNVYEDRTDYNNDSDAILIDHVRKQINNKEFILVFDNLESIMQPGGECGKMSEGYKNYEQLFSIYKDYKNKSTLVLVSREKCSFIIKEEENIFAEQLTGLDENQTQDLLSGYALSGDYGELANQYMGNPQALQLAASFIKEEFSGDINKFLRYSATPKDICNLINEHFNRSSEIEKIILFWLAIERDSMTASSIFDKIVGFPDKDRCSIQNLQNRCLIEKSMAEEQENSYYLQGVILEYLSNCIINKFIDEIYQCKPFYINQIALIDTNSKEYIIDSQKRIFINSIIKKFIESYGEPFLKKSLKNIISEIDTKRSYAAGNVINILSQIDALIIDYDFMSKYIINADLRSVKLKDVNFNNSYFENTLLRNTFGALVDVRFSSNDEYIIGGGTAFNLNLWQADNLKLKYEIKEHTDWIRSVDSNSKYIASSSNDEKVFIYNIYNGELKRIRESSVHKNRVRKIRFSPISESLIFCADDDGLIYRWDFIESEPQLFSKEEDRHKKPIWDFIFVNNGENIVSVSDDMTIKIWDIEGKVLQTLYTHTDGIKSIAYDGQDTIFCGCDDGIIIQCNINNGGVIKHIGHSKTVWGIDFNKNIGQLISCSADGKVLIWNYDVKKELHRKDIIAAHQSAIWSIHFNNKGTLFVTAGEDNEFKVWNVDNHKPLYSMKGYINSLRTLAVSDKSDSIIVGGDDFTIREYSQSTKEIVKKYESHKNRVRHLDWSQTGEEFISVSDDRIVKLWNKSTGRCKEYFGHQRRVWSTAFLSNNKFVSVGEENDIYRWEVDKDKPEKITGHENWIWDIVYCPPKNIFASAGEDNKCIIWEEFTLKNYILGGHEKWLFAIAFSPSGDRLITCSADCTANIYDVNSKSLIFKKLKHGGWVWSAVFISEEIVVTGCQDSIIRVWELINGESYLRKELTEHKSWVVALDYSPKHNRLYSASADQSVKIWDGSTFEYLGELHIDKPYDGVSIQFVRGLTDAEKQSLILLGAKE